MPGPRDNTAEQQASTRSRAVLDADHALLLCLAAWGDPAPAASTQDPWHRLDSHWRKRLDDTRGRSDTPVSSEQALDLLRQSQRSQCRPDPAHVHPSWWIRALQDESPAVRGCVAHHGPPPLRAALREGLLLEGEALEGHEPIPAVADWVLSLAGERLVGGEPVCRDEPAAILALAALSSRGLYRLLHATGQAKSVLATDFQTTLGDRQCDGARKDWFQSDLSSRFGSSAVRAREWAGRDLQQAPGIKGLGKHRRLASLGLNTIARLLTGCDQYRVRWALQHIPYPVAKRIRSLMSLAPTISNSVMRLEGEIFQAAWTRLTLEKRIATGLAETMMRPDHVC